MRNLKKQEHKQINGKRYSLFAQWHMITVLLLFYDLLTSNLSFFLALWLRFDVDYSAIPNYYVVSYYKYIPINIVISIVVFIAMGLYRPVWKFASYLEAIRVVGAAAITGVLHGCLITVIFTRMPLSYYIWGFILQSIFMCWVRFSYRLYILIKSKIKNNQATNRVMLIGAGAAGHIIVRDIISAKETDDNIVCIIDDDPKKQGRSIDGVPIVGNRDEILIVTQRYNINKIYVAIPSASPEDKRDILNICKATGCTLKQLPGVYQLLTDEVSVTKMRDVSVEDLLGREPIKTDLKEVYDFINGKVVLVTGGGGSIGSELCRQIAAHNPRTLIIIDIYENNAYHIQLELRKKYPDLDLKVLIASVRDSRRMFEVFEEYRPQIVYHAAAHKHVPLMEDSPCESIKNNAIGTYKTAYAAMIHGCERFVLISTDKAVNPTKYNGSVKTSL